MNVWLLVWLNGVFEESVVAFSVAAADLDLTCFDAVSVLVVGACLDDVDAEG